MKIRLKGRDCLNSRPKCLGDFNCGFYCCHGIRASVNCNDYLFIKKPIVLGYQYVCLYPAHNPLADAADHASIYCAKPLNAYDYKVIRGGLNILHYLCVVLAFKKPSITLNICCPAFLFKDIKEGIRYYLQP